MMTDEILVQMIMRAAVAGGLRRAAGLEPPALAARLRDRADDFSREASRLMEKVAGRVA